MLHLTPLSSDEIICSPTVKLIRLVSDLGGASEASEVLLLVSISRPSIAVVINRWIWICLCVFAHLFISPTMLPGHFTLYQERLQTCRQVEKPLPYEDDAGTKSQCRAGQMG